MTRKKVTLAYITNDTERKASYKKRKKGLIKKVGELSTLCDVEACAIVSSQFDENPEVWPTRQGAESVLARYMNMPQMDQTRKMVNQESFTRQRIKKAEEQLIRIQKENKRKELEIFMYQCIGKLANMDNFDIRDAVEMRWVVNQTLRTINAKMETLKIEGGQKQDEGVSEAVAAPPAVARETGEEDNGENLPWNLVDSPSGNAYRLGWDDVLPYPYALNNDNASTSAALLEVPPIFGVQNQS